MAQKIQTPNPGEADRYEVAIDLSNKNSSHTQCVLLTGQGKDVLEIGPATGFVTRALKEKGCRVTAIEIDPEAAAQAAEFCDEIIVGDVETFDLENKLQGSWFDVILLGDVLEHLLDPETVLRRLRQFVKESGQLVVSIPNIAHASVRLSLLKGEFAYQDTGLLDRTHLRFFTRKTIIQMFQNAGYSITDWHNVVLSPFETELRLTEADFPSFLLRALKKDIDAEVFQFIFRAAPDAAERRLEEKRPIKSAKSLQPGTIEDLLETEKQLQDALEAATYWKKDSEDLHGLLGEKEQLLKQQERLLSDLKVSLAQMDKLLLDQTTELEASQALLSDLNGKFRRLQGDLDLLRSSAGSRALSIYRSQVHRYFPAGTKRAHAYDLGMRPLKRALKGARGSGRTAPNATPDSRGDETSERLRTEYELWRLRQRLTGDDLHQQRVSVRSRPSRPLVSLILPCFDPEPGKLEETIESIVAQTYPHWELCIANGGPQAETKARLRRLQESDSRIEVLELPENMGISGNSNSAIDAARGAYLGFVDQSDLLEPDALYEVVHALNEDPAIEILYSDFDLIDESGDHFFNPVFTPEWSPELLLSSNYMAHFLVIKRELMRSLGGFRPEMDGAQDWDLLLRATERQRNVFRIPRVLYHWRADASSAAMSLEAKPYAVTAQEQALREHLNRRGLSAALERTDDLHPRIRWRPSGESRVSIIIPSRDNEDLLRRCLTGVKASNYTNYEVLIVETSSRSSELEDRHQRLAEDFDFRTLWWSEPFNYSAVNNYAASHATGDLLLFLNNDTFALSPDWLTELVGWSEIEEIGAVGPQLINDDEVIVHGGVTLGQGGFADHLFKGVKQGEWTLMGSTMWCRNVSAVTGACLMVSRKVFEEVGGWNEQFQLCGSDVELCLRIQRSGRRIVCTPFSRVEHREGSTRQGEVPKEDFYTSYWHYRTHLFGGDPYFNPNLSYHSPIPQLRGPAEPAPIEIVSQVLGRELAAGETKDPAVEALELAGICETSEKDVARTATLHSTLKGFHKPTSINWFIPDFVSPFFGGIFTVLRFARHFQVEHGVKNRFVVVGSGPEPYIRSGLQRAFPELGESEIVVAGPGDIETLPTSDASVGTLWVTAYMLSRFRSTKRKFYFIQDFEPMFYPAGTSYSLAEHTYRMGFYGIANSPTMKQIYESEYEGNAVGFNPAVDTSLFHPSDPRNSGKPYTVFLYGRPGTSRNCYEVAIKALERLKERMGSDVRIIAAGSWQQLRAVDPGGLLKSAGLMEYEETAALYRRCDAGLVLSSSKHPSYLPLELMASGCLVISNRSSATSWLLKDEQNCLLAAPTVESVSRALERGLTDERLRSRLTTSALAEVSEKYSDWETPMENVFDFICNPERFSRGRRR